ncbi:MAG TPA: DUF6468 domain-containing protein [Sphingomonadales bacterium]
MTWTLVVEGVVAVLLAVTIGYAFVLNRRLSALRAEQDNLGRMIAGLNQATARAQEGIYELRAASQAAEESLKKEIARAREMSDELAIITEAGNNLAQKIERGLSARLAEAPAAPKTTDAQRRAVSRLDFEEPKEDADRQHHIRTAIRAAR